MSDITLYEIELDDNHYYICALKSEVDCLANLLSKTDSEWLHAHKPSRIIEQNSIRDHFEVDKRTLYYMAKYGIESTRGGSFQKKILTDDQRELLANMITLNFPESKATREKKPITLPIVSQAHCLLITHEVNLYETLTRELMPSKSLNLMNTLMFEHETAVAKGYIEVTNLNDFVFKPIRGIGRITQLICTAKIPFSVTLKNSTFDYSYMVSLENIYLLPRFYCVLNGARSIIDEDSFGYDVRAEDNKTTINCSFDGPASQWTNGSRPVGGHAKRAPATEIPKPVLINCHYGITIRTYKKINICFINESQYEQLVKESLQS
ncbi:MAG: GIY-YIG nuclease [Hyperionvirus sp.]|uniref:GIY-YIG nuclease n=1 Tax=Hyperionvirus sp. TaxID=2487770 RepID=A0A3G5AAM2_9VIRU|nr:MAG: GIY-YIG nuclease [Hyperionvirus sp.]